MGAKREVGAYGNARGKPDKQRRRRVLRENDPRYREAMEEVRRNQEALEGRLADTPATQGRPVLSFVKDPVPDSLKTARVSMGRFIACHCGESREAHESIKGVQGRCTMCACPYYRPSSAPDPLVLDVEVDEGDLAKLMTRAKESSSKRTVQLAAKIELLLDDLRQRVNEEEAAEEERRRIEEESREAREAVERLQRELKDAQDKLREVSSTTKRTVKKKAPAVVADKPKGQHKCPTCREGKDTPQGLGAHRAKKHGYRKGDDD